MNDRDLRQSILDELEFQPSIDATNIGVVVERGIVTLSGYLPSFVQKRDVIRTVHRIRGVLAVADEIEVRIPGGKQTADDQIAKRAVNIINWDVQLPERAIKIAVRDGWITLSGEVEWQYERLAAEDAVRRLSGVRGISNYITIKPRVQPADVKKRITDALKRHAEVEADAITVEVNGDIVTLKGKVDHWDGRNAVHHAAWAAPGVRIVNDQIQVS